MSAVLDWIAEYGPTIGLIVVNIVAVLWKLYKMHKSVEEIEGQTLLDKYKAAAEQWLQDAVQQSQTEITRAHFEAVAQFLWQKVAGPGAGDVPAFFVDMAWDAWRSLMMADRAGAAMGLRTSRMGPA